MNATVVYKNNYIIELPVNDSLGGFVVEGTPPKVTNIAPTMVEQFYPQWIGKESQLIGCFVVAVQFQGVEVTGFTDANTVHQFLKLHQHVSPRRIVLSSQPNQSNTGTNSGVLLYRHDIPQNISKDLGIVFDGFPAQVKQVDKNSPFFGRIAPGQFVDRIIVPGRPDLMFASGGFTGYRVSQYLQETSNVSETRYIVMKQNAEAPSKKGFTDRDARNPFDLGGFRGFWLSRQRGDKFR
jgi:hypothetical protein